MVIILEEGAGQGNIVIQVTCLQWLHILHISQTGNFSSVTVPVSNVARPRIHIYTVAMSRNISHASIMAQSYLHNGTVMITEKNKLA